MFDIYNNKESFYQKKPKSLWLLSVFVFISLLSLLILSIKLKSFDTYSTKGYVECQDDCYIKTFIPSQIEAKKLKINNKEVDFKIISEELVLDKENFITYYEITILPKTKLKADEILDLHIYYNKQRIITKIKNKIF